MTRHQESIEPLLPAPAPDFPWQNGNQFKLLVNGDRFLESMLTSIQNAREFIWLELYLVESGKLTSRFIDSLLAAHSRGVEILIMLDGVGSAGLKSSDEKQLRGAGIQLRWYNPPRARKLLFNLMRDHRKLLIVDGEVAYVGGAGLTDDFSPNDQQQQPHWRETMVEIRGSVIRDWETLFLMVWNSRSTSPHPLPYRMTKVEGEGMLGRVTATQAAPPLRIQSTMLSEIRHARQRVWIASAYFIPSRKVRKALIQAARRKVDVRLLMPGPHTDHPLVRLASRAFYHHLMKNGVAIYEYQPRFLHMKVALCDNWSSIGSSNMDRWGFFWNLEANQEVRNPQFAAEVENMLTEDFGNSLKMDLQAWISRSRWVQLQEYAWNRFTARVQDGLEKLGEKYKKLRR